jgi:hypothetical protein
MSSTVMVMSGRKPAESWNDMWELGRMSEWRRSPAGDSQDVLYKTREEGGRTKVALGTSAAGEGRRRTESEPRVYEH